MVAVLHRSPRFIAVDKPAGLAVHRARGVHDALLQRVRDHIGGWIYPVHRLDRATAGVVLFGLDPEAARALSELFASGRVSKHYQAVVRGYTPDHEIIDAPLADEEPRGEVAREVQAGRSREQEDLERVRAEDRDVSEHDPRRPAITEFRTLERVELPFAVGRYATARYSFIEALPRTGRTHQIRRHLAHIRHPILGDVRHGDGHHNRALREHFGARRLFLFARALAFDDPWTGTRVTIHAPLDDEAARVLHAMGFTVHCTPTHSSHDGRA